MPSCSDISLHVQLYDIAPVHVKQPSRLSVNNAKDDDTTNINPKYVGIWYGISIGRNVHHGMSRVWTQPMRDDVTMYMYILPVTASCRSCHERRNNLVASLTLHGEI